MFGSQFPIVLSLGLLHRNNDSLHYPIPTANSSYTSQSVVLSNLSYPYTHPSILDIKLGTTLYDRDASEEKKQRMEKRARESTSFEMGLRMTGFQVSETAIL